MSAAPKRYVSEQDYLAGERHSDLKHEYIGGAICALAGASRSHNLIVAAVLAKLYAQLEHRKCTAYPNDLRVKVARRSAYMYPDVTVVCGEEWFEDHHNDILLNPTVIVEVLSPSTEAYDRGKKFEQYRQLPWLREYLLVAQDRRYVEQFGRQGQDQWLLTVHSGPEAEMKLASIECHLQLADVYRKVEFPPVADNTVQDESAGFPTDG